MLQKISYITGTESLKATITQKYFISVCMKNNSVPSYELEKCLSYRVKESLIYYLPGTLPCSPSCICEGKTAFILTMAPKSLLFSGTLTFSRQARNEE